MKRQEHCQRLLTVLAVVFGFGFVAYDAVVPVAMAQGEEVLAYVPVATPCRLVDTRPGQGGAGNLIASAAQNFFAYGDGAVVGGQGGNNAGCDHPRSDQGITPVAVAATITAVGKQATGNGNIVAYPAGGALPGVSTVNYTTAANIANTTIVTLCTSTCPTSGDTGDFALLSSFANVPAVVDTVGYFYPMGGQQRVTVNCPAESIQAAVDKASPNGQLTITIDGTCTEDVTVMRDKVTFEGSINGDVLNGTFNIIGARWIRIANLGVSGPGSGVVGTDNATFTVDNSDIVENDEDGIRVENGAYANITSNIISRNGQNAPPHFGSGVVVTDSGNARIIKNTIKDNLADGIGVFQDGYARVEENTIMGNGLTGSSCGNGGCGIQLSRARVKANGNIIKDNGYAAIAIYNDSVYRTGNYLSSDLGNPNNLLPFEIIEQGIGDRAVEVGRYSLLDLRQVKIQGTMNTFSQAFLQVRGDDVGPDFQCSEIVGDVKVAGNFTVVHLRAVNVTGNIIQTGGALEGNGVCP